jgi:hypothetical protein
MYTMYIIAVLGLNSGLHAGTLPLQPLRQSFFMLGLFEIGSHELFVQAGFKP